MSVSGNSSRRCDCSFLPCDCSPVLYAQAATQRFVGTVTAINGDSLTVKTDAGEVHQVQVPATAVLKRIAPGQKDLSTAETIQLTDVAIGDRVLVKLDPDAPGPPPQVAQLIAMKQSDVAQKQQKEPGGLAAQRCRRLGKERRRHCGVVVLTSGAGPTAKTVTVHITKTTVLKRYAPNSIRYADAQPAPLDACEWATNSARADRRTQMERRLPRMKWYRAASRNISGTVISIDATASTLTVKDLITKKTGHHPHNS